MNTRDEFRNVPVTEADAALSRDAYVMSHLSAVKMALQGLRVSAGWAWSTHATVSASLLSAAGSMQAGLAATTADGQRDSDLLCPRRGR